MFDKIINLFYGRTGIKLGVDWLVEQMGKSKRSEALRARTEAAGKI
jgi:ADP-ribosylation factor related protein 1